MKLAANRGSQFCRDRGFPTTHVSGLPHTCLLSEASPPAYLNYATIDQIPLFRKIIQLAEERGLCKQLDFPGKICT